MADAFAAPGVALAWSVLRGDTDATTMVIVRIVVDAAVYPYGTVVASDPFTKAEVPLLAAAPLAASVDLRVPRARFADFPRTELRLFDSEAAMRSARPALIVFYVGVPDTTPEFVDAAKLDVYLGGRIAQVRAQNGSKP